VSDKKKGEEKVDGASTGEEKRQKRGPGQGKRVSG